MLEIGERVICTKGEENYNTLVLGKTYEITDRALDSFGQWIYKLKSDDGLTCNWIEQWVDENLVVTPGIEPWFDPYFMPVSWYREERIKELGI
jgi:hypothetical protein